MRARIPIVLGTLAALVTAVPSPNNDLADPNDLNAVGVDRVSGQTWAVGDWSGTVPATLTMRYGQAG